ncbi:MAG: nucleoside hydrolase-like domain-containing protein [Candidatus Omnitrophota bacterium]
MNIIIKSLLAAGFFHYCFIACAADFEHGALAGDRYRTIVSTDIGGSDPDDFQSMIHFLAYSDLFDIEGILASPWGEGRKEHILQVIDRYEQDYPKLKAHSDRFPTPDYLRSISKQGAIDIAPSRGYRTPTEGSQWIAACAKKDDPRPLYILTWGLLEDVAQALHDAPEILPKLRVIFIGGPNKKWGVNAFDYVERNFPDLWIVENNSTYRGFFNGGDQSGDLGNLSFYQNHIKGHGALGNYFGHFRDGEIKMGDTPAVTYLFYGTPENPTLDSWGGRFRPVRYRPKFVFDRHTTISDQVETFSVVEFNLKGPDGGPVTDKVQFKVKINDQRFDGYYVGDGIYRFRLCPKSMGIESYEIENPHPWLNGKTGQLTVVSEGTLGRRPYEQEHRFWWTDLLDPSLKEGVHCGAKTMNQWRKDILRHWQRRLKWIQ